MGARLGASQYYWFRVGSRRLTCRQEPDELFETVSQALLNAVDRDALSGWGAHVYIIEKDKVTKRLLKGRQD
jgi:20S proteasome alpha/beta subunit